MKPKCTEPCGDYACDGGCIEAKAQRRSWAEPMEFTQTELSKSAEDAMTTQREHLQAIWAEICETAPGMVWEGKKGLFLDEAMLVKLGAELEP